MGVLYLAKPALRTPGGVCEAPGEGINRRGGPSDCQEEDTEWWRRRPVQRALLVCPIGVRVSLDRLDELDFSRWRCLGESG